MNVTGCYVQGDMFVRLRGDHSQDAVFADEQVLAGFHEIIDHVQNLFLDG
jgi:hypothetical protein